MAEIALVPLSDIFVEAIVHQSGGRAWHQNRAKWLRYLAEHAASERNTLIAFADKEPIAYGSLIYQSKYPPFAEKKMPEISDLVVAEHWRRRGIATRLAGALECDAGCRGHLWIGIGVGLYADYGPAQRLYAKLGFVMDGCGLTAGPDRRTPDPGTMVKVDDDLVLWLTKPVRSTPPTPDPDRL